MPKTALVDGSANAFIFAKRSEVVLLMKDLVSPLQAKIAESRMIIRTGDGPWILFWQVHHEIGLLAGPPQMLETSLPAVFAVGDIRSGNVKRVASAVGEGAISIHLVHRALAEI